MDVFVYGTLTDRATVDSLLDSYAFLGGARVDGLHVAAGTYPTLLPGGEAAGRLLRTEDVATLDRYEGVDEGLYVRVSLPRTDGGTVETYVGDPAALDVDADDAGGPTDADAGGPWPGDGPLDARVRAYVDAAGVVVHPMD
ncbi:MAG: gamma-glutamylcyclotransferase [Haloferacaceae archaeon]